MSRPCGPMPAICCSKPISGGFTITTMTRGRDVGLELAKRARLEKYMQREVIIAQRQELFRLRRAHNISDITFL